jgi:hypothetical protein
LKKKYEKNCQLIMVFGLIVWQTLHLPLEKLILEKLKPIMIFWTHGLMDLVPCPPSVLNHKTLSKMHLMSNFSSIHISLVVLSLQPLWKTCNFKCLFLQSKIFQFWWSWVFKL